MIRDRCGGNLRCAIRDSRADKVDDPLGRQSDAAFGVRLPELAIDCEATFHPKLDMTNVSTCISDFWRCPAGWFAAKDSDRRLAELFTRGCQGGEAYAAGALPPERSHASEEAAQRRGHDEMKFASVDRLTIQ